MKVLSLLLLLFISSGTFGQAVISPRLFDELMQKEKTHELINVNVFLTQTVDFDNLNLRLHGKSFDYRVKTVREELQLVADLSQAEIINFLEKFSEEFPGSIKDIESLWIVNMINITAAPDLIFALADRSDVRFIDLNDERYKLTEPVSIIKDERIKVKNNTEPGLLAINSHLLWEMGYTGRNILFLSMDTGVFTDHPAIKDNFAGNYWPLDQVWFGVRNPFPTDHSSSSHGTHTTGTALGLDPLTNDTIGVAFNSKWMASDPVAGGESELLNPLVFMQVFQWVLNPDGDPETTDDVPRVINNSWGFDHELAAIFGACEMTEAEVLIAIEAAGICSPFSAGNNGPGESTTGFPAMLAFNEVNPLSVGALNHNNTIASFSSRGPTPCVEEEGPLQIKPEVCAPGVNIRSCAGNDSYAYLSGTSMACPHVAGALLLLAEAFPTASAFDLKNALYLTAQDLGEPGENNIYGRGIIDVYEAFNFLAETYDPQPPVNNDYDISIKIVNPKNDTIYCYSHNETIILNIENKGTMPMDAFKLKLFVNDEILTDYTVDTILQPGEIIIIEYQNADFMSGKNMVRAMVDPIQQYNEFCRFNNSHVVYFNQMETMQVPYYENFEGYDNHLTDFDWIIINPNNQNTWEIKKWGEQNDNKALSINWLKYGSRKWEEDHAIMPLFIVPDWDDVYLNFTYSYKKRLEFLYKDSLLVQVSTDCGASFSHTLFRDRGESLATVEGNSDNEEFVPVFANDFDTVSLKLNEFKGQEIVIRFTGKNDRGSAIFIDMVEISDSEPSTVKDIYSNEPYPEIFPNPCGEFVSYIIPERIHGKVCIKIYDVSGKMVLQKNDLDLSGKLNLNNLQKGIYFIRFDMPDATAVRRIVKYE